MKFQDNIHLMWKKEKTKYNAHMVLVLDSSLLHAAARSLLTLFLIFHGQQRKNKMSAHDTSLVCLDTTWLGYDFEQVRVDLITACLDYELSTDDLSSTCTQIILYLHDM